MRDGAARGRRAGAAGRRRRRARARRTVFIAPTRRSLSHTRARKAASEAGARGATLPGVTEDMLARLMACDFPAMARAQPRASPSCSTGAGEAHVTCPRGTDLTLDLTGRDGHRRRRRPHRAAARSATCPAARASSRRWAARARVVRRHAREPRPARRAGPPHRRATAASPTPSGEWGARWTALMDAAGEQGRNLAELGVGTNERATPDRQHPRGREDARHRPRRVRRERRHRRDRRRCPSTSTA